MTVSERTGLNELDPDRCWELLGTHSVGRLAVAVQNRPDIFPVNYRVDDRSVIVRSAPGIKFAAATLGVGVAFEVDELDEAAHTGWSVVLHGTAEEVDGVAERLHAEDLHIEPWATGEKQRFLRIAVETITGREVPS